MSPATAPPSRLLLALAAASLAAGATAALPGGAGAILLLHDDFEGPLAWTAFEEIVNGHPCYGDGIGSVTNAPEAARGGSEGLRVAANAAGAAKSNHLIAARELTHLGAEDVAGRLRYEVHARLPTAWAATTQVGPELSLQDTRHVAAGHHVTQVAGFQYVANPHSLPLWHVWIQAVPAPGLWVPVHAQALETDAWHRIALDVDFGLGRYERLVVEGPGVTTEIDLRAFAVPRELKGFDREAFWVSAEAENLWSGCEGVYRTEVDYDDVFLWRLPEARTRSVRPRRGCPHSRFERRSLNSSSVISPRAYRSFKMSRGFSFDSGALTRIASVMVSTTRSRSRTKGIRSSSLDPLVNLIVIDLPPWSPYRWCVTDAIVERFTLSSRKSDLMMRRLLVTEYVRALRIAHAARRLRPRVKAASTNAKIHRGFSSRSIVSRRLHP